MCHLRPRGSFLVHARLVVARRVSQKGGPPPLSTMTAHMRRSAEDIEIDLAETQRAAELVRDLVRKLRSKHDLERFEYTTRVRVAPGEIPHSHPVLTLNTMLRAEDALLSTYLHEQMHWYVTWYSHARLKGWRAIWKELEESYPTVPVAFPDGAHTLASSHLHLVVNWLEIEAATTFLGREAAVGIASKNFVYSGLYRIVLANWDRLSELYSRHRLVPIRKATDMVDHDLALAARMDEAATDGK